MAQKRQITGQLVKRGSKEEAEFDRAFWRQAGHEARFAAMWQMVAEVELLKGKKPEELRLQRSVAKLIRRVKK